MHEDGARNRVHDGHPGYFVTRGLRARRTPFPAARRSPRLRRAAATSRGSTGGSEVSPSSPFPISLASVSTSNRSPCAELLLANAGGRDQGAAKAWMSDAKGRVTKARRPNAMDRQPRWHPSSRIRSGCDILPGDNPLGRDRRREGAGLAFDAPLRSKRPGVLVRT